jgi:glycosyltransferase involved in cell wall biosynthesis
MAEVIFILETPTPQRTPVLDAMTDNGVDLLALFHASQDVHRGWGKIEPRHPWRTISPGSIRSCLSVARHMSAPGLRVLCCFGYRRPANLLAIIIARIRGVQVVTRSDSNWDYERTRPRVRRILKGAVLRLVYGQRARVWTIGLQNDRYWAAMGLRNRHYIPFEIPRPPVGTAEQGRAFRDKHQLGTGFVVLFVAMLEPHKGIDTLITAFRSLPDSQARLVVVGQGSLGPMVEAAAAADPRIVPCGALPQERLGAAFAAADLFVLPSRREPWGYVVNEAQANGLRVVVSDAVGCAADCVDETNGSVFRTGDADQLAELLMKAAREQERGSLRVARCDGCDPTSEMVADLIRLGVGVGDGVRATQVASTTGEASRADQAGVPTE